MIDMNLRKSWCTPLTEAANLGFFSVVEALLDHGADTEIQKGPNQTTGTPLNRAIDNGYLSIVRLLLQRGANANVLDTYNRTIIHSAAVNGQNEILKLLLEANCGLDVNTQGNNGRTALHDAACPVTVQPSTYYTNTVPKLTFTIMPIASTPWRRQRSKIISTPSVSQPNTAKKERTQASISTWLIWIATRPSPLAVPRPYDDVPSALIIAENIDLNIQDGLLRTPLHWTALYDNYRGAAILLTIDSIDVSVEDVYQENCAFHCAQKLAQRVSSPADGSRVITEAVRRQLGSWQLRLEGGGVEMCERLVRENGADPGRKNGEGEGPFHVAEYAGNVQAARAILRLCGEREGKREGWTE
ncbi:hypothetical protein ABVK25_012280 [Lepraria finkii]|uniref:Ankyrin n=1 Tax=Lepraria finkii TaxID=1340010 RepID=A0ABR4AIG6_9LECA